MAARKPPARSFTGCCRSIGGGLATEAPLASLRYGIETLGLSRVLDLVHPANVRSIRVLGKCGLTFENMTQIGSQPVARYAIHCKTD